MFTCEVQGPSDGVYEFARRLQTDAPPLARLDGVTSERIDIVPGENDFVIAPSAGGPDARMVVPADVAPCAACVAEFTDPTDRRFGYAFTCCVDCGPRYTVVAALPYDRERTSDGLVRAVRGLSSRIRRPGRPAFPRPGHLLPCVRADPGAA